MVECRGGDMASCKSCAVSPEAPSVGKLHVSFPHLQTPTERSRNSVFLLLIDQADMCFACFSVF